ncbi:ethylene receptor [Striga asiatica]|uniref:Ethylene receptor n=1 Tax=Striga asiatica TaxID=4170 RepID=A0A5A7Q3J5_STRAF|nr:ethylene receptor [Striga asiatica]
MCLHPPPPQEFSLDLYDDRAFIRDGLDLAADASTVVMNLREPGVSSIETSAIKFTKEGGISITAFVEKSLRHPRAPTFFLSQVKDTGLGINPQDIPKLFMKFVQSPVPSRRSSGGFSLFQIRQAKK